MPEVPSDPAEILLEMERLKARVARLETYLRLDEASLAPEQAPAQVTAEEREEELEYQIGQEWFAKVGVAALAAGVAFTLSLPYGGLPAAVPSMAGYLLAGAALALARWSSRRMEPMADPLRATAMALGFFASLRLCYFGEVHALPAASLAGAFVMAATAGLNVVLAVRRTSPWLFGLALATGYAAAVASAAPAAALVLMAGFSLAAAAVGSVQRRPSLILTALPMAYLTYLLLALNDPLVGRPLEIVAPTAWAPAVLLVTVAGFSVALLRSTDDREDMLANAGIFLNSGLGSVLFLLHALESYDRGFVAYQAAAALALLALAFLHSRRRDGIGAFICAMSGFLFLSFAILRAAPVPDVFVWLSVQSVVVVATAIWLRSRFIVVANFIIYLGILAGYVIVAEGERGISLGFGVVALVTARLLAWKQERLELKTGLMRNAYLVTAFLVFPYALYHLVPGAWVGLAWVGAALLYYLLAAVLHNPKYRYMAHATLLLTAGYMAVMGIGRLDPFFRTLSFLVLGAVLVVVSFIFSQMRRKR